MQKSNIYIYLCLLLLWIFHSFSQILKGSKAFKGVLTCISNSYKFVCAECFSSPSNAPQPHLPCMECFSEPPHPQVSSWFQPVRGIPRSVVRLEESEDRVVVSLATSLLACQRFVLPLYWNSQLSDSFLHMATISLLVPVNAPLIPSDLEKAWVPTVNSPREPCWFP